MKLSGLSFVLIGLTTVALGSVVSLAKLPLCDDSNNGTTACGSFNSYGNDVFRCIDFTWRWVEYYSDPAIPCENGACYPKPAECHEGVKQCLTTLDHGYDGINICKDGKWETFSECRCTDKPSPHCLPFAHRPRKESTAHSEHDCVEGEVQCVGANDQGLGGGLYECENGQWNLAQDCSEFERCVAEGTPHCSWNAPRPRDSPVGKATFAPHNEDATASTISKSKRNIVAAEPCNDGEQRCYREDHTIRRGEDTLPLCKNGV